MTNHFTATGTKVQKIYHGTTTTDYIGSLVYENSALKYILTDEGHIQYNTETGNLIGYNYFLKDHLGNTRCLLQINNQGTIIAAEPNDYYPFGKELSFGVTQDSDNPYRYNGKELQDELINNNPLDWYDYGTRFYNPVLGHFFTQDRFAEEFSFQSPYVYAQNNPIKYIEVNGDSVWVMSRALNFPGGGIGVHSFIYMKDDETGEETYIGYTKDEDGNLVQITDDVDENWDKDDLKDQIQIETPEGMTDKEHIAKINEVNDSYIQGSLEYEIVIETPDTEGNCNSAVTTIITNAGSPNALDDYDPPGWNPGIGKVNAWTPQQQAKAKKKRELKKKK